MAGPARDHRRDRLLPRRGHQRPPPRAPSGAVGTDPGRRLRAAGQRAFERPLQAGDRQLCQRGRPRHRADGTAAAQPARASAGGLRAAAGGRVLGPAGPARVDPVPGRLRGRDRDPDRCAAPPRARRARRVPSRDPAEPPPAAARARGDGLRGAGRRRTPDRRRPGHHRRQLSEAMGGRRGGRRPRHRAPAAVLRAPRAPRRAVARLFRPRRRLLYGVPFLRSSFTRPAACARRCASSLRSRAASPSWMARDS